MSRVTYFLFAFAISTATCVAAEWKQFRGPDGQGHTDAKELPLTWSETENVRWKTAIPGRGWSSPVFDGDIAWMTTAVEAPLTGDALEKAQKDKLANDPSAKQLSLLASVSLRAVSVDIKTGNLLSDIELLNIPNPPAIHDLNSYASPTPVLDGNLLLCHFGELGTACLDIYAGDVKWKKTLPSSHAVGAGSSPVIFGDLVICTCDGTDLQYVAALNKRTGEQVWKTNRPKMSGQNGDFHKSYCTPLLVEVAGKNQVIIPGAQWVVAYDPADGHEIWRVRYGDGFSNVPRPVIANNMVCVCTGFMQPQLIAIRMDGAGDVTSSHVAWKILKSVPTMPSPVVVDEEIYFVTDQGVATCANAVNGDIVWTKRMGGNYSASPLASAGRLYFSNREGETTVIRPGKQYEELASNKLDGQHMASPAVFENSLLLRTNTHLYRIGQ